LISDAEVAETPYTLRLGRGRTLTVRLVVRRVKDTRYPDALFPVWRHIHVLGDQPRKTGLLSQFQQRHQTSRRHQIPLVKHRRPDGECIR